MGLRPGHLWARAAGGSEFGGGLLTALGLLSPLGSIAVIGAMLVAWTKGHWGKPIWATAGGAELPLTNAAIATALLLTGPGRFSLDGTLGIRLPRWVILPALVGMAATVAHTANAHPPSTETAPETEAAALDAA
jgi:putative oxidoreductase